MKLKIKLKRPDSKESSLFTEFTKHGVTMKFYTGKTITSKNWSVNKELVLSNEPNHDIINKYLEVWKSELCRIIEDMEAKKIRLNQEIIKTELERIMCQDSLEKKDYTEIKESDDFIAFVDRYIKSKRASNRVVQKLEQCRKLIVIAFELAPTKAIIDWEKLNVKKKSASKLETNKRLNYADINLKFIEKFREYLLTAKYKTKIKGVEIYQTYKINYIDKQIKALKQFITAASEAGYIKPFTWNSIKTDEIEVDSIYTDFEEIQNIYDTPLNHPTEIKVRDKYVINCFLGMRYSDFNRLEPHNFKTKVIKGKEYVIYAGRTKKTDTKIEFALPPVAVELLKKYDFNLPKLSAKEYNEVLKRVAKQAGLTALESIREVRGTETIHRNVPKYELLSSHTARRSFCTNYYTEGVSISAIMSISGHTTEEEFRKYIKKPAVRVEVVAEQISAIKGINHLRVA